MVEDLKLWDHQVETIERAKNKKSFAIFHEMGTGKSRTTLELLRHHFNTNKRVMKTIIIAPVIVLNNWVREIEQYTKITKDKVHKLEGPIARKAKSLETLEGIVICNYDVFVNKEFCEAVIKWKPEIIIADESQRIKSPDAKRTKNILKISQSMPKNGIRYLLTGSPVTNNQLDLWSQFMFLDHGKTFGDNYYGYRATFFYNAMANRPNASKNFQLWVPRKGVDEVINKRLKPSASIVRKEDCLSLPPLIRQEIEVEMGPEQKRLYEEMKRDYITFVKDKAAVASIALTKIIRMHQILSGFLKLEDGSIHRFENPRAAVLRELLSDIPGDAKILIWCVFIEDFNTIRQVLNGEGIQHVEINGQLRQSEKDANLELFKTKKDIRVLVGTPASLGIGVNIVCAQYSIWYDRSFRYEEDIQAEARNFRAGSEVHSHVTRYDLITRGTLDELIVGALKNKEDISKNVLGLDVSRL